MAAHQATQSSLAATWLARCVSLNSNFFHVMKVAGWPVVDLAMRLWLAQIFFVSGVIKVTQWQTALSLATTEYPVSWMSPITAAYTGATIEMIAPVFLALGLLTRYAAIPMLILTLVIQFNYLPFDNQLFWAVLFAWFAIQGARSHFGR